MEDLLHIFSTKWNLSNLSLNSDKNPESRCKVRTKLDSLEVELKNWSRDLKIRNKAEIQVREKSWLQNAKKKKDRGAEFFDSKSNDRFMIDSWWIHDRIMIDSWVAEMDAILSKAQ